MICQFDLVLINLFIHLFQLIPIPCLLISHFVEVPNVVPRGSWYRMMGPHLFGDRYQGLILVLVPLNLHVSIVIEETKLAEVTERLSENSLLLEK